MQRKSGWYPHRIFQNLKMVMIAGIREFIIWNVNHNPWPWHIVMCQGISQGTLNRITSHASNQSKHRLVIVIRYYVLVLCSLALWLTVINLYITLDGDVTKVWVHVGSASRVAEVLLFISMPVYKFACRTTVLLRGSSHTVFDLLVHRLGGPLIDTWDGEWIPSPVSEVWQLTPSLLITSFTQSTGLLCLRLYNTTLLRFLLQCIFIVVLIVHFSCCDALLSTFDSFSVS